MIEINDPLGKRAVFQFGADFRIDIEKLPMEDVKMLVGERGRASGRWIIKVLSPEC